MRSRGAERGPSGRPPDRRRELGAAGEDAAAAWYEGAGYVVVDRNWRCREGELDLVARLGDLLVVCEVKTRRTATFGAPVEAVTPAKQRRLRSLATRWLADHDVHVGTVRFDVASVRPGPDGTPLVEVVADAF